MNDEFYIGWEDKAPPAIGSRVRHAVMLLLAMVVALGVMLSLAQRTIGVSVFEWGKVKSFSGIFESQPYPHLLVMRPGANSGQTPFSSYYLVNPFKFGLDPRITDEFNGKAVSVNGTLIYRGNQTMIETKPEWIKASTNQSLVGISRRDVPVDGAAGGTVAPLNAPQTAQRAVPTLQSLGQQTLIGEIVDSKCYLGVMNPGALTPHRACAIRCISGGIPPALLVRQTNGTAQYFLLVSREGKPVNKQVLSMVAEPVEVTGEIERQGDLLILHADPATYRRVAN